MINTEPTFQLLKRLWRHITSQRKRQFVLLFFVTMLGAFAEVVSLGAVLPFIGVLTQPDKIFDYSFTREIADFLGIVSGVDMVLPLAVAFASAALLANGLRLFLLWLGLRIANDTGADLGIEVFRRTLYQPYRVHVARGSSEIIGGITQKVGLSTGVLIAAANMITSLLLFVSIMATLLVIDTTIAVVASVSFGVAYVAIAMLTRRRLLRNSQCIATEQIRAIKSLQEGLGAIRDVLLDGTQRVYCESYSNSVRPLQRAASENSFIGGAPRYFMEALGMALVAVLVLILSRRPEGVAAALPLLGVLGIGAQRLLPLMQQIFGNWATVSGSRAALIDVLALLEQPLPKEVNDPDPMPLTLKQEIRFDKVCFQYGSGESWVLDGIDLQIPRGARVGFVGSTGSGKSTTLDLLMGLLEPTRGQVSVDGRLIDEGARRAWQRTIAHVPQHIFLSDASIAENIAFGVPAAQIDHGRVRLAAEQAKIAEFIESRPDGYRAAVGERGVRLSGGQRQRIGIARALYKQASVLIFDEATSALDNETEQAVMAAIDDLSADLTVLIIAHRLSTLRKCTQIVQLDGGSAKCGSYEEMIGRLA